jgi:polysaccharide biosynthesis/export protein
VLSSRLSAFLFGLAVLLHGVCAAQGVVPPGAAAGAAPRSQSPDLRLGSARPLESTGNITDGGIRIPPSAPVMAAPFLTIGKDYRVGPHDLIDVEVLDVDSLKRTVRVNAAGMISLPLIGQVPVAGLSAHEVEDRIADRYREKYLQNPQVSIFIKEFTSERIAIEGAVSRPGIFPLTGQMTLLRALAMAGGFGSMANATQVMLYRVNEQQVRETMVYDVEQIRAGTSEDPRIQGDDLIVVQRSSSRVLLRDSLFRDVLDTLNPFSVLAPY